MESVFVLRHPDLSFDDGNLVLCPHNGPHYFIVHHGFLSHHSSYFTSTGSGGGDSVVEGRPAVVLQDSANDLLLFLKALYDGIMLLRHSVEDFPVIAAILRLATKYGVGPLRTALLQRMEEYWPTTLGQWELRERRATDSAGQYRPRSFYPHPILIINLAREIDAPRLLPSAFYDLSRYLPSQTVAGYACPIDLTVHQLKPEDLVSTLKGKECASRFLSSFIVSEMEGREVSDFCTKNVDGDTGGRKGCRIAFEAITFELLRDINGLVCNRNSDPLFAVSESLAMQLRCEASGTGSKETRNCEFCRLELAVVVKSACEAIWSRLPVWFDVKVENWNVEL